MDVRNLKKRGFTMIELLVVIVIIGILAGTLFPAVTGFMLTGKMTGLQGNGGKIVKAINQADQSGYYAGRAWPTSEPEEGGEATEGPQMDKKFGSTAEYFTQALNMSETNPIKRAQDAVLEGIDPSTLAAEGVTAATGTTINDRNCAWIIAENVGRFGSLLPEKTPVLITRNIEPSALLNLAANENTNKSDSILNTNKPFGREGCVIIYPSGGGKIFKAKEVRGSSMLEGFTGKLSDLKTDTINFTYLKGSN